MKYIRTKDGIYLTKDVAIHDHSRVYISKIGKWSKSLNQADTIEELCDEFVCVNENETPFLVSIYEEINGEKHVYRFGFPKEYSIKDCLKEYIIYAAIWTDKGLIYVAKMNDKGELELL